MSFVAQGVASASGNRVVEREGMAESAAQASVKPEGNAFIRLRTHGGVVLVIPLHSDRGVVAVLSDNDSVPCGSSEAEMRRATWEAARWLMPSLSPELVAEVLGLGSESSEPG
ncbi:hypothetical protein GCM10022245_04440 [Streptomyces mayteni]